MENGSKGTATIGGGSALSTDMLYTGPTSVGPLPGAQTPSAATPVAGPSSSPNPKPPQKRQLKKLLLTLGVAIGGMLLIVGAVYAFEALRPDNNGAQQNDSKQFSNTEVPLDQLVNQDGISVLGTRSLVINGQLRTNDGLVVAPGGAPGKPTAGQIYYDNARNELGYYNGSQFIYITASDGETTVNSIGGASGDVTAGTGLVLVGNALTNSGVLSFQGQTGDVTLSAGTGISVDGSTITNNGDLTVGNEITDVVSGGGLLRVGSGTTIDPYSVALQTCANGEVLKSNGSTWACDTDNGTATTAGNGLQLVGNEFSVNSPTCAGTDKLQWNGTAFVCSLDAGGVLYSAGTGLSLVGSTFNNTGALTVTASGALTSSGGQNPNIAFANGTTNGQFWQWDGSAWVLATLPAGGDPTVGNEVTGVTGANSGLVRSGAGTTGDPYTLAVNAGAGLQLNSGAVSILSATCAGTDKLQWTGIGFICSADVDTDTNTTYGAITNGGLRLSGTNFGLSICATGELLQAQAVSGEWGCVTPAAIGVAYTAGNGLGLDGSNEFSIDSPTCAGTDKLQWTGTAFVCSTDIDTDTNTTYSAGTGMSLVGTTFNNTGILSVTGSGPITATVGQNPTIAFADGTTSGQFWQWNGTAWVLASLPGEGDAVVGNEVTDVTGANSGLVRSGSGTSGSPYTLAVSAGNGLQLNGGAVTINSATCAGTDKLQWTGTAFLCAADVDTDTNTTYGTITNGGLRLSGTNFGLSICANGEILQAQAVSGEWSCVSPTSVGTSYTAGDGLALTGTDFDIDSPTCAGTDKLQWTGTAFTCSADIDTNTDAQTLSWVDGTRTLSISNGNSVVISDDDTTYSSLTNGGLRLVGTEFALGICTDGQILKAQATSGEWACADDSDTNTTYSAGTGMSLVGTTFNNTGILSIAGSGAITATAGQNPTVAFADGSSNGQFWQWNGTAWALATLPAEADGVIGNEVTNVTGANSGLSRSGAGTGGSPYTLSVIPCANTEILQSTGSGAWACASPTGVGTSYNVIANGGIRLVGNNFGLKTCASGELLQAQATSGEWDCANPSGVGISYSAGTGIDITGTTISNTGVITVIGSGPITSTGGANPSIDFADGTANGEFWQWNGSAWVLATLPAESDAVIGNEVTGVTGANSGLTRSGSGTGGSPYTLAINAGSGLQLSAGTLTIGSPTCLGTTKLQWNGTGFLCSVDVDTNTTYSTIANGGLRLSGTNFGLSICATGELLQAQATSGEWACVAPSSVGTAYTGGDGLTLTGTDFDIDSPTCAGTTKLQWNGTAFVCSADVDTNTTYTSGTGLSLVGTTFNNTGALTVTANGALTSSGGQNPNIAFADGSSNGQFWQWNGTAWVLATIAAEGDAVVGNEVTGVTGANSGLARSGTGTGGDPYTLAVNAGNGLQLSGGAVLVSSPTCAGTDKLQWTGTAFLCASDVDTNTTYTAIANGGLRLSGASFGLSICATGELLQAQVTSGEWACVAPSSVGVAYTGGDGLTLTGTDFDIDSPTCAGTTKLQWNGTAFVCSADVDAQTLSWVSGTRTLSISNGNSVVISDADTTYSALTNGGLRQVGTQFALSTCTTNQIIKAQVTSGEWACAADADTTYTGGTGISVVGTTINNSGILSLSGSSNFSITGGQNATVAFANGTSGGQVWQWNGSAWVLVTIAAGTDTLQTTYTASTGGTTPEIKLDATRGGLDIQDADTTIGANLLNVRASNGSGLGATLFGIGNTGITTFQNSADSTSAFKVLSQAGGSMINVDTLASKTSFGVASDFDTVTKLSVAGGTPSNAVTGLAWSPDSQYVSATFTTTSPYVFVYKRVGDTLTKLANPPAAASHGRGTAWSPDGTYMTVVHDAAPFVTIYKRSGDTFTKLPDLGVGVRPAGNGYGTAWSPDGQYMSVAHETSPFISIYKRSGDTFTKLSNPSGLPAAAGRGTAWSPNGQYLTVTNDTAPFLTIYKKSGDTFTKLPDLGVGVRPAGTNSQGNGPSWSPDSTYMTVAHETTPFMTTYKRSGDTFTKLADLGAGLPAGDGAASAWSPNGNYMSIAHAGGSSCVSVYSRSGDTLTPMAAPPTPPTGDCRSTSWSPDGRFMLAGNNLSPFINVYKATDGGPRVDTDIYGRLSVSGTTTITQGNLTVEGNITSTSLLSSQTGNIAGALDVGGPATFKNSTDSATSFQIQDAAGAGLFTADSVNDRVVIGNATADGVGVALVLDTKNTAGDPTGVDGGMYYNSSTSKFRCYEGGVWKDCLNPWTRVTKVADQTKNNDATLANDNNLQFAMAASTNYDIRCEIFFDTPNAPDFKYDTAGPASPTRVRLFGTWYGAENGGAGMATDVTMDVNGSPTAIVAQDTGGTGGYISTNGIWENGTNAGTWAFRWAQNLSDAGNTKVLKGSYCDYRVQ